MNNKFMLLTLISSLATSAMQAESNTALPFTIDPKTNKSSAIKVVWKQITPNRSREDDLHIPLPWLNKDQKLQVNVAQAAHLLALAGTLSSMWPTEESSMSITGTIGIPLPNINRYNLALSIALAYRIIAGEEKWPFRLVNAPEQADLEKEEEKDDSNA